MMKFFSFIAVLMLTVTVFAQSPNQMSYQAVVRDNNNQLVINRRLGMRISILQGSADGTVVYNEVQTPTTNANGLVTVQIGGGDGFDAIDWSNEIGRAHV